MNYLEASVICLFGMIGGHGVAYWFLASNIDGTTNIPLGAVLGSAGTVLFVGMWVSRKTTAFEIKLEQQGNEIAAIRASQAQRTDRLDLIDERLYKLEHHLR